MGIFPLFPFRIDVSDKFCYRTQAFELVRGFAISARICCASGSVVYPHDQQTGHSDLVRSAKPLSRA
jgi:hypothetical protein